MNCCQPEEILDGKSIREAHFCFKRQFEEIPPRLVKMFFHLIFQSSFLSEEKNLFFPNKLFQQIVASTAEKQVHLNFWLLWFPIVLRLKNGRRKASC